MKKFPNWSYEKMCLLTGLEGRTENIWLSARTHGFAALGPYLLISSQIFPHRTPTQSISTYSHQHTCLCRLFTWTHSTLDALNDSDALLVFLGKHGRWKYFNAYSRVTVKTLVVWFGEPRRSRRATVEEPKRSRRGAEEEPKRSRDSSVLRGTPHKIQSKNTKLIHSSSGKCFLINDYRSTPSAPSTPSNFVTCPRLKDKLVK